MTCRNGGEEGIAAAGQPLGDRAGFDDLVVQGAGHGGDSQRAEGGDPERVPIA
ncbi:hypothetical protein AB0E64_26920 [Streptomyces caelestis]|uniref:Uncharacterized protein n=1 Tax=Streptomyces caelestis TaxID=36816 RepID=A0A7W9LTB9_9ACTN|nr:hypothetical protein [Streptomyces caelestis]MBB5795401.1 hypothetical protein [Streptomyces caelestis]